MTASPLLRAIIAMTIASAFIAFTTVMAKGLAGGFETDTTLHPLQVGFGRFFFAAILWALIWFGTGQRFEKVHLRLHGIRVLLGYLTSTSIFWASSLMVLADATAISFLSPMITLLLAWLFLRERVGWMRIFAVAVMVTGAMILLRPGTSAFQPAALIALFAALTGGVEAIAIKVLTNRERVLEILTQQLERVLLNAADDEIALVEADAEHEGDGVDDSSDRADASKKALDWLRELESVTSYSGFATALSSSALDSRSSSSLCLPMLPLVLGYFFECLFRLPVRCFRP